MRTAVIALAAVSLAACVSQRMDRDGTIQTSSEANRDGLGGAIAAPLRDVNMLQTKIPAILLTAKADAYARPADGCAAIIAEVGALNEALGADLDEAPSGTGDLITRGKAVAKDTALGVVAGTAQDLIPLRSWVRRLTGAERHDQLVSASIVAGGVRRGYLKGLGEARGCNPPGTPKHLGEPAEVIVQKPGPRYPIH